MADQSLFTDGSSEESIIRLHDLVECPLLERLIQGQYTQDYAKRSEHWRKASWYGIEDNPSITLNITLFDYY